MAAEKAVRAAVMEEATVVVGVEPAERVAAEGTVEVTAAAQSVAHSQRSLCRTGRQLVAQNLLP